MATIKGYTNLEQSKKLAEILPLESADMHIIYQNYGDHGCFEVGLEYHTWDATHIDGYYPCWSLAALLDVLPFHIIANNQRYAFNMIKGLDKNGETYAIKYAIFNTTFYLHLTDYYNNPIDACYEMILKLHELKML